jgi:cytochrome c-type biogenesis protein CcmE
MIRRRAAVLLSLVAAAGVAVLIVSSMQNTLVYYKTPSELTAGSAGKVRLGGLVVAGSLRESAGVTEFRLTDGTRTVPVVVDAAPPGTLRERQGAIVEGRLRTDGVFHGDEVVVKHGNEYRPPGPSRAAP